MKPLQLLSCGLIGLFACTENQKMNSEELPTSPVMKVEAVTVNPKPVGFEILADGILIAPVKQELYFSQSGRLAGILASTGMKVAVGDTLAVLENASDIAMLRAERQLEQAQYAFESAMLSFRQTNDLTDTVRKSLWHESGLAMAEAAYEEVKQEKAKQILIARQSGYVAGLKKWAGEKVEAGETFGILYSPDQLQVEAYVLELHSQRVVKGMHVMIMDMAGKKYPGKVIHKDEWVDPDGFFRIWIAPETFVAVPGSHTTVTLYHRMHEALTVPVEAVMVRSDKLMVYKLQQGKASWQYIQGGMQTGKVLEVIEGLKAGDTVIVNRLAELGHGMPVEVHLTP